MTLLSWLNFHLGRFLEKEVRLRLDYQCIEGSRYLNNWISDHYSDVRELTCLDSWVHLA